ncbi:MAG: type II CRISPR RNA-guided endonuclease Cas9 [Chitinophagales bacterium]
MKKILGLDLGVASIGYCFLLADNMGKPKKVLKMGVRIVPLTPDEKSEFESGNTITKNAKRTQRRTMRKGFDRYQLRREALERALKEKNMMPESLACNDSLSLYKLRAEAVQKQITLQEIGRILWLLNQKRGYKSLRGTDVASDGKLTEYETKINERAAILAADGITIGQYFYNQLKDNRYARLKEQIFPRVCYIHEFNAILSQQKQYYPDVITEDWIEKVREEIVYYQRPLKSQKHLVKICPFEGYELKTSEGKKILIGPKVAPRSSPLFQLCRLWESINAISIEDKYGQKRFISKEEKEQIFDWLNRGNHLKQTDLMKILGLKKGQFVFDELIRKKGLNANITVAKIKQVIGDNPAYQEWLRFSLTTETFLQNKETGEIGTKISSNYEKEPLYKLWHLLYSIGDADILMDNLVNKLNFDRVTAQRLIKIDFKSEGYSNKSAKNISKILPFLMEGRVYSMAMSAIGQNHSDSKTLLEAEAQPILDKLEIIKRNSLRQPVVEKILNQLVHVVNGILDHPDLGHPDEIKIELARDLRQSKEERNNTYSRNNLRDREAKQIAKKLEEHGIKASKRNIERYRLWEEFEQQSAYGPFNPAKPIGLHDVFSSNYDVDHIIPKTKLFDDSFANKVLVNRKQNSDKKDMTAYEYMSSLKEDQLDAYVSKVNELFSNGRISKAKRDRLLMKSEDIPDDFINRQINETRYITKEAKKMLASLLPRKEHNILVTTGSVTAYLREKWGWNNLLVDLNFDKYPEEVRRIEQLPSGQRVKKIDNWSKRDDHRHHAIDALVIAATDRSLIQRMNTLNQNGSLKENSSLENQVIANQPFSTDIVKEAVADILVSVKAGKKVSALSFNPAGGKKVLVPRGALCEETVYGKISLDGEQEYVVKYPVDINLKPQDLEFIIDPVVKKILEARLALFQGDPKKAFRNLQEDPIYFNEEKRIPIKSVRMRTNLNFAEPVKFDENDNPIGYAKPGNNHHVAIYENEKGKRIERVVTFWEAVQRKKAGLSVIDKHPEPGWKFVTSLQQNEMFIFNMDEGEIKQAIEDHNYRLLSKNLFRVRKITKGNYWFNHHLETEPRESMADKIAGRCKFASAGSFQGIKVRINHLGEITKIGE